jgi:hypothetical protein
MVMSRLSAAQLCKTYSEICREILLKEAPDAAQHMALFRPC